MPPMSRTDTTCTNIRTPGKRLPCCNEWELGRIQLDRVGFVPAPVPPLGLLNLAGVDAHGTASRTASADNRQATSL